VLDWSLGMMFHEEIRDEQGANEIVFKERVVVSCNISKTSASVSSGVPNTEKQMKARGRLGCFGLPR